MLFIAINHILRESSSTLAEFDTFVAQEGCDLRNIVYIYEEQQRALIIQAQERIFFAEQKLTSKVCEVLLCCACANQLSKNIPPSLTQEAPVPVPVFVAQCFQIYFSKIIPLDRFRLCRESANRKHEPSAYDAT